MALQPEQEEEQTLRASVDRTNPVQQFMGLSSTQDDNNYVSALIKGCTKEACTRHSATVTDRHPEVAQCFQTKVLTTFHDDPGSNLFCESQFESIARDSRAYLTRAAQ